MTFSSDPEVGKPATRQLPERDLPGDHASTGRAVLVTQWYSPEPVSVPILTAKELAESGLTVQVLTGIPNLPDGDVHAPYKAWKAYKENLDGIRLIRAPLYPSHSASAPKRMLNYLSWSISATVVGWRALRTSDVNVVHCTPATAAIPALVARWLHGTPYVVIVQDLWPDTVTASGFLRSAWANRLVSRALDKAVATLYGGAAQIAVISDGMQETLEERGFDPDRISRVFNSVDETVFEPQEVNPHIRSRYGISDDALLLIYAGNQGSAQDLEPLVHAVADLKKQGVELLLVGWGVERQKLEDLAGKVAPDNVHFVDRVSPSEVATIQSAADLCVVSLKDDPLFRITIPSKLQTLLASGRAVLGIVAGDPRKIIEEASAGFVADPGDSDSIRKAISTARAQSRESLDSMGKAGRNYYLTHMSSRRRSSKLRRLFDKARRSISKVPK